jgi:hypothetical protein
LEINKVPIPEPVPAPMLRRNHELPSQILSRVAARVGEIRGRRHSLPAGEREGSEGRRRRWLLVSCQGRRSRGSPKVGHGHELSIHFHHLQEEHVDSAIIPDISEQSSATLQRPSIRNATRSLNFNGICRRPLWESALNTFNCDTEE